MQLRLIQIIFFIFVFGAYAEKGEQCLRYYSMAHEPLTFKQKINQTIKKLSFKDYDHNYYQIVSALEKNDQVQLPSGQVFTLFEYLGGSDMTRVFDIGEGKVLRLSKLKDKSMAKDSLVGYMNLYKELKREGVSVAEVDMVLSELPYAIVVKRYEFKFYGHDFMSFEEAGWPEYIPYEMRERAKKNFYQFMVSTWRYQDISDVVPRQLGFDGESWVLFDFYGFSSPFHQPLRNFEQQDTVMHSRNQEDPDSYDRYQIQFLSPEVEERSRKIVNNYRKKIRKKAIWYERSAFITSNYGEFIDRVTPYPLPKGFTREVKTGHSYFRRDFRGFFPRNENALSIEIEKPSGMDSIWTSYNGNVNKMFKVKIFILKSDVNAEGFQVIQNKIKKLRKNNRIYISGSDFIVVFDSKDKKLFEKN
ncbi:MAG: hypothetical protein JNL11_08795 [Bdellovibrionaceae bacterium]|nr:hypothetical protein [Pseudobdellovibrionaceae bacterium]